MGILSGTKPHFHPRLLMYIYIVATIYFSGENFSQTVSCFKYSFQIAADAKLEIYFANTIMMASVFKYLPKSEAAVHTCSFKKLF